MGIHVFKRAALAAVCLIWTAAAQTTPMGPWDVGTEPGTVTAIFLEAPEGGGGTLAVSGAGAMKDFSLPVEDPFLGPPHDPSPWYERFAESITAVVVEEGVTAIGAYAFAMLTNVREVSIAASVTGIGMYAFLSNAALTSITVPNGVTAIEFGMFTGCYNLTSVNIGDGVTRIEHSAFANTGLTSITIPNSVTHIGALAFWNCADLTSITIPGSVKTIERMAFADAGLTSIVFSEGVETIGSEAFFGVAGLTSVSIPNSVTFIGDRAFKRCANLENVTIGSGLDSIGIGVFSETDVGFINVADDNPSFRAVDGVLFNKAQTVLVMYPAARHNAYYLFYGTPSISYVIPSSVTAIAPGAFMDCRNLTSVTIPSGVETIGDRAFYGADKLARIINLNPDPQALLPDNIVSPAHIQNVSLLVAEENIEAYKSADYWKDFPNIYMLASLSMFRVTNTPHLLEPLFDPGITSYTIMLPNANSILKPYIAGFMANQAYVGATVICKGDGLIELAGKNTCDFEIGAASAFEITVKAGSSAQTYNFNIIRRPVAVFNSQGGSAASPQVIPLDGKVSMPETVFLSGHAFVGWYRESECVNAWDFDEDTAVSDVTLFAKWEEGTSVLAGDRLIPATGGDEENVSVIPINALTAKFTAGPNPVDKNFGMISFYRQGRRIDSAVLTIYNASGNFINRVNIGDKLITGDNQGKRTVGSWDLRDRRGRLVADGVYLAMGVITGVDGKKERVSLLINVR